MSADEAGMSARADTDSLQTLADTLWSERQVVEHLLYKLTAAKLLLAADEGRFIALALDEVERVVDALRQAEDRRSATVAAVARSWRMSPHDLTLQHLATHTPEPWRDTFADHQRAFGELAQEIDLAADANRKLATAGLSRVHRAMDMLTSGERGGARDATGRDKPAMAIPMRLDATL